MRESVLCHKFPAGANGKQGAETIAHPAHLAAQRPRRSVRRDPGTAPTALPRHSGRGIAAGVVAGRAHPARHERRNEDGRREQQEHADRKRDVFRRRPRRIAHRRAQALAEPVHRREGGHDAHRLGHKIQADPRTA